jgi:dolichol-phosphate mannosyltransferase
MLTNLQAPRVAVVIPCYRVIDHILGVINGIGDEVAVIFAVDDCCPDNSAEYIEKHCSDPRVIVLRNALNLGVGGAVMTGYRAAVEAGMDVIVKIDGDGQMDASLVSRLIAPIIKHQADYTKGNRFYDLTRIGSMPLMRLLGNAGLSFMAKFSTGYWSLFDPTNGFTAISARVAAHLPYEKISNRYFFETDVLFRLNILRAVVVDIPMDAIYGEEVSNLKISKIFMEFLLKHLRNFFKRIFYNYYLRDMNIASFELISGFVLFSFGIVFGGIHWMHGIWNNITTPVGTIIIAALCIIIGFQLLLAFLNYDVSNVPRRPITMDLPR